MMLGALDNKLIDRYGKNIYQSNSRTFNMIDNYVYMYHTGTFIILPTYPESIQDQMSTSYNSSTILGRSAPIQSFTGAGPRQLQVSVRLHRDMMKQINWGKSNANVALGDDYVDTMVKQLKACAYPDYKSSLKMVDPPLVAVRFGNDIFIKGVVNGGVSVTYNLPLLADNKYAVVDVSFNVVEIDPFGALDIMRQGSFTGLDTTLERRLFTK